MWTHDAKKKTPSLHIPKKDAKPHNVGGQYDSLMQMASLVGNSAMEAYLRQEQAPQSNALVPESGGQELPSSLRERMETRLGVPMDDVRVHYNSEKPASFMARAFTKGNQIYVAPGQEDTLEHELGHVAQQKVGLVRPMGRINGEAVNEDDGLEREADVNPDNFFNNGFLGNPSSGIIQFMRSAKKPGRGGQDGTRRSHRTSDHSSSQPRLQSGGRGNHYFNDVGGAFRRLLGEMGDIFATIRAYSSDADESYRSRFSPISNTINEIRPSINQVIQNFLSLRDIEETGANGFRGFDYGSVRTEAAAAGSDPESVDNSQIFGRIFKQIREPTLRAIRRPKNEAADAITELDEAITNLEVLMNNIDRYTIDLNLSPDALGVNNLNRERFDAWAQHVKDLIHEMCRLFRELLLKLREFFLHLHGLSLRPQIPNS